MAEHRNEEEGRTQQTAECSHRLCHLLEYRCTKGRDMFLLFEVPMGHPWRVCKKQMS